MLANPLVPGSLDYISSDPLGILNVKKPWLLNQGLFITPEVLKRQLLGLQPSLPWPS